MSGLAELRNDLRNEVRYGLRYLVRDSAVGDRKSTRLNSSHSQISYAVFCLKKKKLIPSLSSPKPWRSLYGPFLLVIVGGLMILFLGMCVAFTFEGASWPLVLEVIAPPLGGL